MTFLSIHRSGHDRINWVNRNQLPVEPSRVIDGHLSNTKTYILAKTCCAVLYRFEQQIANVAKSNPNFLLRYALETKIQIGVRYKYTVTPLWFKKVQFCSDKTFELH